jgi:hypothetical protein
MAINIEGDPHVEQLMVGRSLAFLKFTEGQGREPVGQKFHPLSRQSVMSEHLVKQSAGVVTRYEIRALAPTTPNGAILLHTQSPLPK